MSGLRYREVEHDDIRALARLRALRLGTEEHWQVRISQYLDRVAHPQKALPERVINVASDGDDVVGFIAGHLTRRYKCDGELQWIDVAPECRGQGVAAELLRMLASWFISHEAPRVCVNVDPDNTIARQFYLRQGAVTLNKHWLVWNDISVVGCERSANR